MILHAIQTPATLCSHTLMQQTCITLPKPAQLALNSVAVQDLLLPATYQLSCIGMCHHPCCVSQPWLVIVLCFLFRLGTAGKAVVPVSIPLGGPELLRGACPMLHCSLHMTYLGHRYPVSAAPTAPLFDPPLSLQRHALVAGSSCSCQSVRLHI